MEHLLNISYNSTHLTGRRHAHKRADYRDERLERLSAEESPAGTFGIDRPKKCQRLTHEKSATRRRARSRSPEDVHRKPTSRSQTLGRDKLENELRSTVDARVASQTCHGPLSFLTHHLKIRLRSPLGLMQPRWCPPASEPFTRGGDRLPPPLGSVQPHLLPPAYVPLIRGGPASARGLYRTTRGHLLFLTPIPRDYIPSPNPLVDYPVGSGHVTYNHWLDTLHRLNAELTAPSYTEGLISFPTPVPRDCSLLETSARIQHLTIVYIVYNYCLDILHIIPSVNCISSINKPYYYVTIKTKLLIVAQCIVAWRESKREPKNDNKDRPHPDKGIEIHSSKANLGEIHDLIRAILLCGECKKK